MKPPIWPPKPPADARAGRVISPWSTGSTSGALGLPFNRVLAEAIADISRAGYVSPEQIEVWIRRLRSAAEQHLGPDEQIDRETADRLRAAFTKLVDGGKIDQYVPEVSRFNLAMVKPRLYAELDRRIVAAADLIRLNRREAVQKMLDRFSGWSTSIPPGGDRTIDKVETRTSIGKSVAQVKYEARRVNIDQGAKLIANIADIVAQDGGAIAAIWNDHGEHDKNYNARKEHLARSGKTFIIRGSWAHQRGLLKAPNGYTDEIEMVGQLPFCQCWYQYVTSPRRLADQFLTRAGQEFVTKKAA